jgi:plastocyanin
MVQHTSVTCSRSKFLWSILLLVVVLSFALAGCGEASTPASPMQSNSLQSSASGTTYTVTITEKVGTHDIYSFDPQTISVKAGSTVKWVNNSDENHLLASSTAGTFTATSIVHRSGSSDNTYQETFNTPGTYSYSSTLVQRQNNQPEGMTSSATGTITVTA